MNKNFERITLLLLLKIYTNLMSINDNSCLCNNYILCYRFLKIVKSQCVNKHHFNKYHIEILQNIYFVT